MIWKISNDNGRPRTYPSTLIFDATGSMSAKNSTARYAATTFLKICTKIGEIGVELKNEYVLGYHSTNEAKGGKWRKIRLKINGPKGLPPLSVRGKSGYYAETLNSKQ